MSKNPQRSPIVENLTKTFELENGKIYIGYIISYDDLTGNVEVQVENQKINCWWTANIFSGLAGFNINLKPEPKTKVLVLIHEHSENGFIISTISDEEYIKELADITNGVSSKLPLTYEINKIYNGKKSVFKKSKKDFADLLPGEMSIQNAMGSALSLLKFCSSLGASDLAKIEFFVIDDFVRLISENFSHISSFGEHRIVNDGGKINVIWEGSSDEHEVMGKVNSSDQKADSKGKNIYDKKLNDFNENGRYRYKNFMGHLGDFIHIFLSDPTKQIGELANSAISSGRFACHVNKNGALAVRSVADISFEKVVRVPVPIELKKPENPEGNKLNEEIDQLDKTPLKEWEHSNQSNLWETAYTLRDYSRWFRNYFSLAQFIGQNKDWYVPSESETPEPDKNCSDPRKQDVNQVGSSNHTALIEKYSTFRIFNDGSILIYSAYGNCINMAGANIQISATNNLFLEAGNNIVMTGKNINALAKNNIELTAGNGVLTRGINFIQSLCEKGTLLLQSNGDPDANDNKLLDKAGILIKSNNANINLHSLYKNLEVKCLGFFNNVTTFINRLTKFRINDSYEFRGHKESGLINNKCVNYQGDTIADSLSSKIELPIPLPNTDGNIKNLVFHHEDDNPELDELTEKEKESIERELSEDSNFKYPEDRGSIESTQHYESLTQQYLEFDDEDSDKYETWSITDLISNDRNVGFPWPGKDPVSVKYNPKDTTSLNKPSDKRQFENKPGSFNDKNMSFKIRKD